MSGRRSVRVCECRGVRCTRRRSGLSISVHSRSSTARRSRRGVVDDDVLELGGECHG
nr:MAG TPA: hypothetical protein [Caudoviricetes sp.]